MKLVPWAKAKAERRNGKTDTLQASDILSLRTRLNTTVRNTISFIINYCFWWISAISHSLSLYFKLCLSEYKSRCWSLCASDRYSGISSKQSAVWWETQQPLDTLSCSMTDTLTGSFFSICLLRTAQRKRLVWWKPGCGINSPSRRTWGAGLKRSRKPSGWASPAPDSTKIGNLGRLQARHSLKGRNYRVWGGGDKTRLSEQLFSVKQGCSFNRVI